MVMGEQEKNEGKINLMNFITVEDTHRLIDVMKEEKGREEEEKGKRRIDCWVCGKEGTIAISYAKGYTYVYCVHTAKERCYLGRADRILKDLLFGLKKIRKQQQQKEEGQKGGENK
jgi:hypothetical protein